MTSPNISYKTIIIMNRKILLRLFTLVACLLCALGAAAAEAYACYTSSNTTLTFYYDNNRASRTGTTYDLKTGGSSPGWYTDGTYSSVTKVVFDPTFADARPTSCYYWFRKMSNLTTITGISYLNTSQVTHMNNMFYECSGLTSLDVSHFNTANVLGMTGMFYGCSGLTSLNLSGFNTAKALLMSSMFEGCSSLTSLNLSSFNTANVTIMSRMFYGCSSLTSLNVSGFNTDKVTNMSYMFAGCVGLTSLNVSSFNTAKVTNMEAMFFGCSGLTSLNVSNFNTAIVTSMRRLFSNCGGLTSLDLSSFNTANVTDMSMMFFSCGLRGLDLTSFNTYQVTTMSEMFSGCGYLVTVTVGEGWNTGGVTYSNSMFANCIRIKGSMGTTYSSSHTNKDYAHIDGGPSNPGYFTDPNSEAYACYTPSNTTLTFYFDRQRSSRTGTTYDLNGVNAVPVWHRDSTCRSVTSLVFNPSFVAARPTTTWNWFCDMTNL